MTASVNETSEILQGLAATTGDTERKLHLIESYIYSLDMSVRISAVKSVGILCRIHKSANFDRAIEILKSKAGDGELSGYIEDALEDIGIFRAK